MTPFSSSSACDSMFAAAFGMSTAVPKCGSIIVHTWLYVSDVCPSLIPDSFPAGPCLMLELIGRCVHICSAEALSSMMLLG